MIRHLFDAKKQTRLGKTEALSFWFQVGFLHAGVSKSARVESSRSPAGESDSPQ